MTEGALEILYAVLELLVGGLGGYVLGKGKRLAELKAIRDLGRDLPTLILDHEKVSRQKDEYLATIEEVIKEREQWRELYNDQAAGHDNAQALMLQTLRAS